MVRLSDPKRKSLSLKDLERFPVWVWDDENENLLPLSEENPSIYEYGTLFIKAKFKTISEYTFDGYLIGTSAFYAFGLFVENREFIMNLNLPEFIKKNMEEIYLLLQCKPFELFPLRYEACVSLKEKKEISGSLSL